MQKEYKVIVEYYDSKKVYFINWLNQKDQLHREDGPAIEWANGTKEWFLNGERHRADGPACEFANGDKYWYLNNKRHREDGPAIEHAANGDKECGFPRTRHEWWLNGKLHRTDGPAIEWANGSKDWWLNDKSLTEQEFLQQTQSLPSCEGKVVEIDGKKYQLIEV